MSKRRKQMWQLTDGNQFYSFDITKARRGHLVLNTSTAELATRFDAVLAQLIVSKYGSVMSGFDFVRYDPRRNRSQSRTAISTCEAATTAAQNASSARQADRRNDLSASLLSSSSRNALPFIVMDDTIEGREKLGAGNSTMFSIPASSSSRTKGSSSFEIQKRVSLVALVKMAMYFSLAALFFALMSFVLIFIRTW